MKKQITTIQQRAKECMNEMDTLLKKRGLAMRPVINFSNKKKTPLLSRIAVWVVVKQGGHVDLQFNELKKK
jgi:hypothetical protein